MSTGIMLTLRTAGFFVVNTGPLQLSPGHAASLLLPVLVIFRQNLRDVLWKWLFALVSGVAMADFYFLIVRANTSLGSIDRTGLFLWTLSVPVISCAMALLLLGWCEHHTNRPASGPWTLGHWGSFTVGVLLSIAMFRASHEAMLLRGVPNDERSLIVLGQEVHHAVFGIIGTYILGIVSWIYPGILHRIPFIVVGGFLVGTFADQGVYYALREVTDASYSGALSFYGGICLAVLYSVCGFLSASVRSHANSPPS